jgi:sugar phosphate isomerase/epimerase
MEISISNIAWDKQDDEQVFSILQEHKITGLDVAPARVFDNPMEISKEDGQGFVKTIGKRGLHPVGMQSLLFGTNGMALFEDEDRRKKTINQLKAMIDYAGKIGITRLVFGSPKNRLIGTQSKEITQKLAYEVFSELGDYATANSVYFCIEPNPVEYGADFITNTLEGIELVKKVNKPGFRLHMDLGTMIMNNEDIDEVVRMGIDVTEHVHLSHPYLEQVIGLEDVHKKFYESLIHNKYRGTVAIEMKHSMQPDNIDRVRETIEFISSVYGGNKDE